MSKNKNIFRVGDKVKIINPLIFIRVGYPLNIEIVKNTIITPEQKDAINIMLKAFNLDTSNDIFLGYSEAYEDILYRMSRIVLKDKRWGGSERKIYTENKPELLNNTGIVRSKRVVKTGFRESGRSYRSDYYGEPDYDPPYLAQETTHIILNMDTDGNGDHIGFFGENIEIEQINVIKL